VRAFEASGGAAQSDARHRAIRQLLTSEEAYVAKVCQYVHSFVGPLRRQAAALGVSADDVQTLNANCDAIYKWHLQVLLELKRRVEVDKAFVVGDLLTAIAPSDVYATYTQHYDNAIAVFERLRAGGGGGGGGGGEFAQFLQQCRQREPSFSTDLCAYLLCPVQRLQAYKDLAVAVRDATARTHPARGGAEAAVGVVERAFDLVNRGAQAALARRQASSGVAAVPAALQRAWAERRGVLQKQGAINKTWKTRFFVLKNLHLYYYKDDDSSKPLGIIPIDAGTRVVAVGAAGRFTITHHQHRVYQLAAADARQADEWLDALRAAIDSYAQLGDAHVRRRDAELQLEALRSGGAGAGAGSNVDAAEQAATRALYEQCAALRAALAAAEARLAAQISDAYAAHRLRLRRHAEKVPKLEAALQAHIAALLEEELAGTAGVPNLPLSTLEELHSTIADANKAPSVGVDSKDVEALKRELEKLRVKETKD
jgi:hypothetical protein